MRETNLCFNCQAILGREKFWRKSVDAHWDSPYVHHPSTDSLQRSAQAGCQLCIKVMPTRRSVAWAVCEVQDSESVYQAYAASLLGYLLKG